MKRTLFAMVFCLALTALPASAQVALYGGGGAAFPSGDDLSDVDAGLQLFGGLTLDLNERISVYAEGQWGTHNVDDVDVDKAKPAAIMGGLLFGLTSDEDAPVQPYIFGGGGLQSVTVDLATGDSFDDSTFGWQVGAGIGFALGGLDAFAEGRYQAASYDADSDLGEFDFAIFSLAVGLSFELGGS